MSDATVIYRDLSSNRLITAKEAATREPDTWVEDIFVQNLSTNGNSHREDLPSVKLLASSKGGSSTENLQF